MERNNNSKKSLSRRKFLGSTAAVAAFSMVPMKLFGAGMPAVKGQAGGKPNSNFGGVQIGAITYSWRDQPSGIENIIKYCTAAGISSIELMSGDLEEYLGAPKNPMMAMFAPPPPPQKLRKDSSCYTSTSAATQRIDTGTERCYCKIQ